MQAPHPDKDSTSPKRRDTEFFAETAPAPRSVFGRCKSKREQ